MWRGGGRTGARCGGRRGGPDASTGGSGGGLAEGSGDGTGHGCRVVLDPAPAPAEGLPEELYRLCDCITPNETEAQALVGWSISDAGSAHRAAEELMRRGAKAAVIKMGERGAYYLAEGERGQVPAFPVKAVDTVAAGDAFNAGLAVALAEDHTLAEAVRWGAAAGAVAVTRIGAQGAMPRRVEVEGLLRGG